MIFRLKAEIGLPEISTSQESSQAMQIAPEPSAASGGAGPSTVPPTSDQAAAGGAATLDVSAPEAPPVPYHRRVLLKSLLRAIALASYAPGTAARPDVRLSPLTVIQKRTPGHVNLVAWDSEVPLGSSVQDMYQKKWEAARLQ